MAQADPCTYLRLECSGDLAISERRILKAPAHLVRLLLLQSTQHKCCDAAGSCVSSCLHAISTLSIMSTITTRPASVPALQPLSVRVASLGRAISMWEERQALHIAADPKQVEKMGELRRNTRSVDTNVGVKH